MTLRRIALLGDSEMQGTITDSDYASSGKGSMAELAADRIANISGIGPLLSPGFRSVALSTAGLNSSDEWLQSGSGWTATVATDAYDKAPQGLAAVNAGGSSNIEKWTKPAQWRPIVAYDVTIVDYTSAGNCQVREDGGTWFNITQTLLQNNTVLTFRVNRPILSTMEIRAYDGSGNVGVCVVGITPYFSTAADGIVFDNYGHDGTKLSGMTSTNGDRYAIFDAERLGTGSPLSHAPTGSVILHINDVKDNNTTTWNTLLTTTYNRLSPLGPCGFITPWDVEIADYPQAQQDAYRVQTRTTALTLGAKLLDVDLQWKANGWSTLAQEVAAGLLDGIQVHPSQAGNVELAPRVYWWFRNNFLSVANAPSTYTATGKQAAVQYLGKQAAVQYAAATPIGIG